jgi:hypothetical protein
VCAIAVWIAHTCDPPDCLRSFDAKHGTDVIIEGRNFGDVVGLHGVVSLNGSQCYNTLFVHDGEIRCTLPGEQVVGEVPLTVTTWNPALGNNSSEASSMAQTSNTVFITVKCPENFYGRLNEVGTQRW